jgi:hypothetical protein
MCETGVIFACLLLQMSQIFNGEVAQRNNLACLSAAGDKAEFMSSTFDQMRQFNSLNWYHTISE